MFPENEDNRSKGVSRENRLLAFQAAAPKITAAVQLFLGIKKYIYLFRVDQLPPSESAMEIEGLFTFHECRLDTGNTLVNIVASQSKQW